LLGTTQLPGESLTTVRVDALCLLFLMGAICTTRLVDRQPVSASRLSALSGLLVALSILTKQTAAVVALALLVLSLPQPRARLFPYLAGLLATLSAAGLYLLASSDGWARFYLVDLPRNHTPDWSMVVGFWTQYLFPHMLAPVVLGGIYVISRSVRRDYTVWFYALAAGSLVAMGWVSILNPGGNTNTLRPAFAGLALLFGLGFTETVRLARARLPELRAASLGLLAVAGLTLVALEYSPGPTASLRANALAGQRLMDAMAALPGSVWAPELGEFQLRAGKGDQAYPAMWHELLGSYGGTLLPEGRQFLNNLDDALSTAQYAEVLMDPEGLDPTLNALLSQHGYMKVGPLFRKDDVFFLWGRGRSSGGGSLTPAPDVYVPAVQVGT
jgi:hypothetical protein